MLRFSPKAAMEEAEIDRRRSASPLLPVPIGDLPPRHHIDGLPALVLIPAVDEAQDDLPVALLVKEVIKPSEVPEEILVDRSAGFHFPEDNPGPRVYDQIDFESLGLPVVEQPRVETLMHSALEELSHNPALENLAFKRMVPELFRGPDSKQNTDETRVEKVELGRLDLLLPEVPSPSGNPRDQEARLQHGEP